MFHQQCQNNYSILIFYRLYYLHKSCDDLHEKSVIKLANHRPESIMNKREQKLNRKIENGEIQGVK